MGGTASGAIAGALRDALAALSPVDCAGCGAPDRSLCADCLLALVPDVTARPISAGVAVYTALRYEGVARAVLLRLKENDRTDVARPLGRALAAAAATAAGAAAGVAVPAGTTMTDATIEFAAVPASRSGRRRRGYDPVGLLARRAEVRLAGVLARDRATGIQKSLGWQERSLNLQGSMRAGRPLEGRKFVLIDDVLTTGATLTEAARAIREGGGEVVAGAVVAFTPRRLASSHRIP